MRRYDINNSDRGSKKWCCILLPEHVEQLRDFLHDEYYHEKEPEIDEDLLNEIGIIASEAMEYNYEVKIKVFQNNRIKELNGHIHYFDWDKKCIGFADKEGHAYLFSVQMIKGLEIV